MMTIPAVGMGSQDTNRADTLQTVFSGPHPIAYDPAMEVEVRFVPSEKRVCVAPGTPLLKAAQQAGLPIASSCSASGLCARCGVRVVEGCHSLSDETQSESEVKRANRMDPELRLACMATVSGDVTVTATYW
jgi:2Fe-2S ferredoxin